MILESDDIQKSKDTQILDTRGFESSPIPKRYKCRDLRVGNFFDATVKKFGNLKD